MTSRIDVRPACGRRAAIRFYLSLGLVRVCEINRIHHWCSVGTEKSQHEGPLRSSGKEACRVSRLTVDPRVVIFLEPLNTNDRFFFSYTMTVRYSVISVGDVTEVDVNSQ